MATHSDSNNGLYLLVGALLVAVAFMAYFWLGNATPSSKTSSTTTVIEQPAGGEESSSFNMSIDEDSISATQTTTEEN